MTIRVEHHLIFSQPFLTELNHLKDGIMEALDSVTAKINESNAKIAELGTEIEASNAKTDALIVAANMIKDQLAALQANGGATAEQLAAVQALVQTGIDAASVSKASVVAQEGETDAAVAGLTP